MDREQLLVEQWRLLSEIARHEDNLSWQKFGYGVVINGALLGALTISPTLLNAADSPVRMLFPALGVVVCGLWHLMQSRVREYQKLRLEQAKEVETVLEGLMQHPFGIYRTVIPQRRWPYSLGAQALLTWIPVVCALLWLGVCVVVGFVSYPKT